MISIQRYTPLFTSDWNNFVAQSINATFFFYRDYLDYHADRFTDHSLMIYEGLRLIALLPANESAKNIISHEGLTFGGLLVGQKLKLSDTLAVFYHLAKYYFEFGFEKIIYKPIPTFYHQAHYEDDLYALFLLKASLIRKDAGSVLDKSLPIVYQERRNRSIKKALNAQVSIVVDDQLAPFWDQILIPNLASKFGVKPVHSLTEISKLKSLFPQKIIQANAYIDHIIVCGTTLFINKNVAHAQYISSSDMGRDTGALDYLFDCLIKDTFPEARYFSFGISTINKGLSLNKGLTDWKEGFGAHTWCNDVYEIDPKNYNLVTTNN